MGRQMGQPEQKALGARETSREELRAQRRERESGRLAGGVGAQTPGLVTEEGGRGRRGQEKSQQTPRGGGERRREAPLGLFPAGL